MNIAAITIAAAVGLLLFLWLRRLGRKARATWSAFKSGWRNGFPTG
jgi:hypothetical protein